MTASAEELFVWRDLPACGGRVEHPLLRQPITVIVDDPTPGYNPAYFHSGFRNGPLRAAPELIDEFADLVADTGMRGKFSVIPYPFGMGRVDRAVDGVSDQERRHFLEITRTRIAPYLDITPEALTHWNALDLSTGQLLPYWEHLWSRAQNRGTLTPYLTLALEIMNGADLPSTGVTSPWDFGDGVETEYAEAILAAQQQVNGRSFTWYFLQMDGESRHVPPQLTVLRPEAEEAVVGIVTCDTHDFGRDVWHGGEPNPDMLISADGQSGRLAAVLSAGGPAAFHTHWQTLFSQGTRSGMRALGEVARRIQEHFGAQAGWIGCHELAVYTAAAGTVSVTAGDGADGNAELLIQAPFPAANFTISVPHQGAVRDVQLDGRPLTRAASLQAIGTGSFFEGNGRLYLCWNLAGRQRIGIVPA